MPHGVTLCAVCVQFVCFQALGPSSTLVGPWIRHEPKAFDHGSYLAQVALERLQAQMCPNPGPIPKSELELHSKFDHNR